MTVNNSQYFGNVSYIHSFKTKKIDKISQVYLCADSIPKNITIL